MNNISTIRDIGKYSNSQSLYRSMATHSIGEKARSFSNVDKAQYKLKNILGFNKEA